MANKKKGSSQATTEELAEEFNNPEVTDYHGRKRELLKKGVDQGSLSWEQIEEDLPKEHMNDTELEVFLFTCRNMGINITGTPTDERLQRRLDMAT